MNREDFNQRLAEIPPEARRNLDAMYREHFAQRLDGGSDFKLDDHLWQAYAFRMHGAADDVMPRAMRLSQNYVAALREALNIC